MAGIAATHLIKQAVRTHASGLEHLVERLDRNGHRFFQLAEDLVVLFFHQADFGCHFVGADQRVLRVRNDLIAFFGGFGQCVAHEGDGCVRGCVARDNGPVIFQLVAQIGVQLFGRFAIFHGLGQRRLNDVQTGFQFTATVFRFQQLRLHQRNLFQCDVETFLRGNRFGCALIPFMGQIVQSLLVCYLVATRLFTEVARSDRVHEQNGCCDNRPRYNRRTAQERDQLGFRPKADKACIVV